MRNKNWILIETRVVTYVSSDEMWRVGRGVGNFIYLNGEYFSTFTQFFPLID